MSVCIHDIMCMYVPIIRDVLKGDNIWFGNPVTQAWTKINCKIHLHISSVC